MKEAKKLEKKFAGSIFLSGKKKERMVRDFYEGETRNGKTMKSYWVNLKVNQEDCDGRNKRKGEKE